MRERDYPTTTLAGAGQNMIAKEAYREDVTVAENIASKIKWHQEAIRELEQAQEQLRPLLEIRIDLLRKAMML